MKSSESFFIERGNSKQRQAANERNWETCVALGIPYIAVRPHRTVATVAYDLFSVPGHRMRETKYLTFFEAVQAYIKAFICEHESALRKANIKFIYGPTCGDFFRVPCGLAPILAASIAACAKMQD